MHTGNGGKSRSPKVLRSSHGERITEQSGSSLNRKSGKQVANHFTRGVGKNDSRYWRSRIFRPVNDRGETSPHYSMRLQMRGQRMAFSLGTSNADAAARIAANIYGNFLTLGVEGALAKYRPQKSEDIATIGEYLRAAHGVMDVRPATFHAYARHLCRLAGDIVKIQRSSVRKTKLKARRQAVEANLLSIFHAGSCAGVAAFLPRKGWTRRTQGTSSANFRQFNHSPGAEFIRAKGGEVLKDSTPPPTAPLCGCRVFPS